MKALSANWFTEGRIDFELKKYTLLAYLQQVQSNFTAHRLYPELSDLISHYSNLLHFREEKTKMENQFPATIAGIDRENLSLLIEKQALNDYLMKEVEEIILFSIPQINARMQIGKELYDDIEEQLQVCPVGIVPLYNAEGYLLLRNGNVAKADVYEYQITLFENAEERYRGINTTYIDSYKLSIGNTPENIKSNLVKRYKHLPNPAVYVIESSESYPLQETLLPIAKRTLVRSIASIT